MKIHKYDTELASKNNANGVIEFKTALLVGVIGMITPAILLGAEIIGLIPALIIWALVVLIVVYLVRKTGAISKSLSSVLIEDKDDLYYIMVNPHFSIKRPSETSTLLSLDLSSAFTENQSDDEMAEEDGLNEEMIAVEIAQNDKVIAALFDLYQKNKIESTFGTTLYGKPIYVSKILDKNFITGYKKYYKVSCIKENGKKSTIIIPNAYPTFFV